MRETKGAATAAIAICALIAVVAGLAVSGGPVHARKERRDQQRLQDIQRISQEISCQTVELGRLPDMPTRSDACPGDLPLTDPGTGAPYEYSLVDDRHWRICAAFELPDQLDELFYGAQLDREAGCFVFAADPPGNREFTPMDQFVVKPQD